MLLCSRCQSVLADGSAFCNHCGQPLQPQTYQAEPYNEPPSQPPPATQKSKASGWLLLFLGVSAFCGLGQCINFMSALKSSPPTDSGYTSKYTSAQASPTPFIPPALNYLVVDKSRWESGGFGAIAIWRVTFRNTSDKPIGNIVYETHYYSETGGEVDKGGSAGLLGDTKTIQKVIPPKASRTVEVNDGFTNHQAHRASFRVTGCEFVSDQR